MSYLLNSKKFNRKVRRKFDYGEGLSIISLVDILTILLVFLIKNVSLEGQKYSVPSQMQFPVTMQKRDLLENKGTTVIQIYPNRIMIGDKGQFGTLEEFETNSKKREDILQYLRYTAEEITREKDANGNPKTPAALLIQADRSIPCWYITEFVKLGTSSYYEYIYFASLLESDWLNKSKSATDEE